MAFVLKQSTSYKWPVTFKMPTDGGKYEKHTFDAEFKRLPQSRINELQVEVNRRIKATERDEEYDGEVSDLSLASEVLLGWSGVVDDDGDEVAFTEANKAQLLNVPMMSGAIIEAYFDSLAGKKAKN